MMKRISYTDLAVLSRAAAKSARRRMNQNLHDSLEEPVQRLLNAFAPGTYVPPHRHAHPAKWELFVILSGRAVVLCFDDNGSVTERLELDAAGEMRLAEIPADTWHSLAALSADTVLFEVKPGPYQPNAPQDIAPWAARESTPAAIEFERWCHHARPGDRLPPGAAEKPGATV